MARSSFAYIRHDFLLGQETPRAGTRRKNERKETRGPRESNTLWGDDPANFFVKLGWLC